MPTARSRGSRPVAIKSFPVVVNDDALDVRVTSETVISLGGLRVRGLLENLTSILEELRISQASERLLFRVVWKGSWGSAPLGQDILPGNAVVHPLGNPNFDWRSWLQNHGARYGGSSVGTSCTAGLPSCHHDRIAIQSQWQNRHRHHRNPRTILG